MSKTYFTGLEESRLASAMAPFALAMLLGAMIPESDFDVKEYHLEGPKEFFLARRMSFFLEIGGQSNGALSGATILAGMNVYPF